MIKMTRIKLLIILLLLTPALLPAQEPVVIHVDATAKLGPFKPIWSYFGYDEPNYTYAKNGRKPISELSAMSCAPVYLRTHFLLPDQAAFYRSIPG